MKTACARRGSAIRQVAQGEVLHNDDTTVKILELMGQRGQPETVTGAEDEGNDADERTGLFTSGVVALADGHRVALFFSGRRHAVALLSNSHEDYSFGAWTEEDSGLWSAEPIARRRS